MKKRGPPPASSVLSSSPPSSSAWIRGGGGGGRFRLCMRLLLCVSVLVCIITLLRVGWSTTSSQAPAKFAAEPLLPAGVPLKVAFLFLARSNLPLDFLWHAFFENAEEGRYSIYIHSEPGFVFNKSTTRSPFFYGRQIRESVKVIWGGSTMIEAERLLLAAALDDPLNQRFTLLSDSCVPLYNFSYVYGYLMSSSKSFVDSFLDRKEGRYIDKMYPTIPKDKWRKGSQWISLIRRHSKIIVIDNVIFPVFKKFCRRRTKEELSRKLKNKAIMEKEHDCIPDEHYVQTLLSMSGLEEELERRTLTYTSWNQSTKEGKRSWHPMTFEFPDASQQHIMELRKIGHVYYETEHRTEWCQCNGTSVPCFLFARKFSKGAAMRLLEGGVVGRKSLVVHDIS